MSEPENIVYDISRNLFKAIQYAFLLGEIRGLGHVPQTGPCILAVNHSSHFDPPFIGAGIRRHFNFFARKTLWVGGFANWWLDTVGTIPVDRDGDSDISALKRTLAALRDGGLLTLFPEGTRSENGELRQAKPGIGLIAAKSQAIVVPCRIFNSHKVLPRSAKFPNLNVPVDVVYGTPMSPAQYDPGRSAGKERYQQIADNIMSAIAALPKPKPRVV